MTMTNDKLAEAVARFNKTPSNVEAADLADEIIRQLWAEREGQRAAMVKAKELIGLAKNTGSDTYLDKALAALESVGV